MKKYKKILENFHLYDRNKTIINGIWMDEPGLIHLTVFTQGTMFGDSEVVAKHLNYLQDVDGRDTMAISTTNSNVFKMDMDTLAIIQKDYNSIFGELKKDAILRFKMLQISIANQLRHYISRAIDGDNDEFGIESSDEITDIEEIFEEIMIHPERIDYILEYNLRRLPTGF